jgi:acetyltransferase-like isoleucine patch superfamily enzyme
MIAKLIKIVTGRDYVISAGDLGYMMSKGGVPMLRGLVWSALHLRRWQGLMLGPNIQWVMSGKIHFGQGSLIGGFSYIDGSARDGIILEDRVTIREHAWIQGRSGLNDPAEGLWIGSRSYIGPRAVIGIGGPIHIGKGVQAGAGLTITAEAHAADESGSFVSGQTQRRGVRIGARCWLGNNVSILDGVEIGEDCVIGANSLVTRSIPARSVAFGAPARVHRTITASYAAS